MPFRRSVLERSLLEKRKGIVPVFSVAFISKRKLYANWEQTVPFTVKREPFVPSSESRVECIGPNLAIYEQLFRITRSFEQHLFRLVSSQKE